MIFIQKDEETLSAEGGAVYQHCVMERLKAKILPSDILMSGDIDFNEAHLVVGSVEVIQYVLRSMDKPIPEPDYYPLSLSEYLYRDVWPLTASEALLTIMMGTEKPLFIKSHDWKRFTGAVIKPKHVNGELMVMDGDTALWASEVVRWLSEYRVYVLNGEIVSVDCYAGPEENPPMIDLNVVKAAIPKLQAQYDRAAYSFDWGVLSTGETALIENNDGWAIGKYSEISARQYFEFLKVRWDQLVK